MSPTKAYVSLNPRFLLHKTKSMMKDIISNHVFEYDLAKRIVIFYGDTNDVDKFIDDINSFMKKIKDYKADVFTVTVQNVKFVGEATRILLLEVLCELTIVSKKVVVNWHYDTPAVLAIGQEFGELLDEIEFKFYELIENT